MERAEGSEPVKLGMNLAASFSELTSLVYKRRRGRRQRGCSEFGVLMFYKVGKNTELANAEPLLLKEPSGKAPCGPLITCSSANG